MRKRIDTERSSAKEEQRKRRERLRKARRGLEQVFHAAPPMAVIALDGTILEVNETCAAFFGRDRSELIGRPCRDAMPGSRCGTASCCLEWAREEAPHEMETEKHLGDGTTAACLVKSCPYRDSDGKLLGMVQSFTDITHRKRAERSLEESERQYRTLYESSRDAIMTLTPEEGFLSANPATLKMFGCSSEGEFTQHSPADFSPEHQPGGASSFAEAQRMMAVAMEQGTHFFEWKHRRMDGSEFFATVLLTRMELGGKPVLQATVRDVSRQKETEAALREKEQQLRHQDKMSAVGGLAGGMAHEFNNLLQAIQGYTRFAMDGLSPGSRAHQDLEQALAAAGQAANLTAQLLSFSRREAPNLDRVDPNRVVGELARMLRPLIGEHIDLQVMLDEEVGAIRADAGLLKQALMNLCINARDAMPAGGTVTIRTDNVWVTEDRADINPSLRLGRYARLMITDDGCGMTSEVREKIFEPFFTTKEVGEGTGLGLAMVYGVVKQHEGAINVYSEPGNGTTFRIYLPGVEQPGTGEHADGEEPDHSGNETILVAEDEPLVRDVAVRILERAGYATLAAADGQEAVRLFREHADDVALLLSDVVMPRLGGHEVLRQIRAIRPDVPVLFCTGYDPAAAQVGFLADEGLALVEKPFTGASLLKAVRAALARNSSVEPALEAVGQGAESITP